jgi:dnd system-associated protein 4
MRDIRRPDDTEPVVELLVTPRRGEDGEPLFQTIMELLIFSAGVGFSLKERSPVPASSKVIPYIVFERNQKDGYIHLLALADAKTPESLASKESDHAVQTFEEYAAGGLRIMQRWLNENPTDTFGIDTLMSKISQELSRNPTPPDKKPDPV